MGFFSSIGSFLVKGVKAVGRVAAGILGIGKRAPAAVLGGAALATGGAIAGAALDRFGRPVGDAAAGGLVPFAGGGRGNGLTFTMTIVQTLASADGSLVSQRVLPGSPFIMNFERTAAKKFNKLASRAAKRRGEPSLQKQLTKAVVEGAIRKAGAAAVC